MQYDTALLLKEILVSSSTARMVFTSEDAGFLSSTRITEDVVACMFQPSSAPVAKTSSMANTPPRSARRRSPAPPQHPPAAWLVAAAQRHEQAREDPPPSAPAAQRWTAAAGAYTRGTREAAEPIAGTESMPPLARAAARELATIRANLGRHPCCVRAKPAHYGHRGAAGAGTLPSCFHGACPWRAICSAETWCDKAFLYMHAYDHAA